MLVKVTLAGKQHEVHLPGDADTLLCEDLVAICSQQLGVPPQKQRLLHKGKTLQPEVSLSGCGVADGAKIMLLATGAQTKVSGRSIGAEEAVYRAQHWHEGVLTVLRACIAGAAGGAAGSS